MRLVLSDDIGELSFHSPEIQCPTHDNNECGKSRRGNDRARRCLGSEQSPAKSIHDADLLYIVESGMETPAAI